MICGAICGTIVLAPFVRGPGDPTGHGIGAGLGGLVSMFFALAMRTMSRYLASQEIGIPGE
jgi:hypothetical protein